jgi:hypothetical protein
MAQRLVTERGAVLSIQCVGGGITLDCQAICGAQRPVRRTENIFRPGLGSTSDHPKSLWLYKLGYPFGFQFRSRRWAGACVR